MIQQYIELIIKKDCLTEIRSKFIIENSISGLEFKPILNHNSLFVLCDDNSVYEFEGNECLKTKYKNPFDYYCDRYGMTSETIELKVMENIRNQMNNTTYYIVYYKHDFIRIQYKNVYDYCAQELQITYKTIHLKLQNKIQKELNIKCEYKMEI